MVIPTDYDSWTRYLPSPMREKWSTFLREIHSYTQDTFWDDNQVSAASVKPGATAPAWGVLIGGVRTWLFSKTLENSVDFPVQMFHKYKEGTDIYPHVHWAPMDADTGIVVWELEYEWVNFEGAFTGTTTIEVEDAGDGTSKKHQIAVLPTISGTGMTMSSILMCRLSRLGNDGDDTYDNTAALLHADFHYEIDQPGSDQEYVK